MECFLTIHNIRLIITDNMVALLLRLVFSGKIHNTQKNSIPRSKLRSIKLAMHQSYKVFGPHSVSVVAKQVPLALSNSHGIRQMPTWLVTHGYKMILMKTVLGSNHDLIVI